MTINPQSPRGLREAYYFWILSLEKCRMLRWVVVDNYVVQILKTGCELRKPRHRDTAGVVGFH